MSNVRSLSMGLMSLIIGVLLITSCKTLGPGSQTKTWDHLSESERPILNQLDKDIIDYQSMVEEALVLRKEAIMFYNGLKSGERQVDHLTSGDLRALSSGLVSYLELRDKIFKLINKYKTWDQKGNQPGLDKHLRLKGVMLALSAALVLYDNYNAAVVLYQNDRKLRRKLNENDQAYKIQSDSLLDISISFHSNHNRREVKKAINRYKNYNSWIGYASDGDMNLAYLNILIKNSPSYEVFTSASHFKRIADKVTKYVTFLRDGRDDMNDLREGTMNELSKVFGNTMGLFATRKGKMYNKPKVEQAILAELKPLDIILEKTPFRLTDKFIPGHFGHVAIWMGTRPELEELGVWDELSAEHKAKIESGHGVLEALRDGVQLNTMAHFLNIDDYAALRYEGMTLTQKREFIRLAFGQDGKKYDFNFDVETQDKIVCSELAYVVYTDLDWPTKATLGRVTISPDNVAEKALNNGPLRLISFYHDGKKVSDKNAYKLYEDLQKKGNRGSPFAAVQAQAQRIVE